MASFFDTPNPRFTKLTVKDNIVTDSNGKVLTEQDTKGFNNILRQHTINYNAKLFAELTGTPYHSWIKLTDKEQEALMKFIQPELDKISKKAKTFRENKLTKAFKKRSERANRVKNKNKIKI
jgi:hypothetical protein